MEEIRASARRRRQSVSEYVREALREARRNESGGDADAKLLVVREGARYGYPVADPEQINAEIAAGYGRETS